MSDELSADGIERRLRHKELDVRVYRTISSTNTVLKALAADGAGANLALVAEHQTAGRGRMGRSFCSPSGTGLYFSLLLRPKVPAAEAMSITACAAVAVSRTIEELTGRSTRIKWVNDILIGQKKVCGILTEAGIDAETGMLRYAVIGVGINVREPEGGFPPEIAGIAGAVTGQSAPYSPLSYRMPLLLVLEVPRTRILVELRFDVAFLSNILGFVLNLYCQLNLLVSLLILGRSEAWFLFFAFSAI